MYKFWVRNTNLNEAAGLADDYYEARRGAQTDTGQKCLPKNSGNRPASSGDGQGVEEGNESYTDQKGTTNSDTKSPIIL